ncbi:TIGR02234 family membrane protein, partial [Corynebacterium durum]
MAKAFVAVGAGVLWVSSRLTWINVTASDDKSGESTQPLVGATWSTEIMALSLLLLAGFVASLVLRKTGRRVVGIVCAVAAAAASWAPLGLLAGEPDPARAKSLLTSGVATQNSSAPTTLSDWA